MTTFAHPASRIPMTHLCLEGFERGNYAGDTCPVCGNVIELPARKEIVASDGKDARPAGMTLAAWEYERLSYGEVMQ